MLGARGAMCCELRHTRGPKPRINLASACWDCAIRMSNAPKQENVNACVGQSPPEGSSEPSEALASAHPNAWPPMPRRLQHVPHLRHFITTSPPKNACENRLSWPPCPAGPLSHSSHLVFMV